MTQSMWGSCFFSTARKFLKDGLLALGGVPLGEEIVEAGKAVPQRLLGKIAQALGDQLAILIEVFDALGDDLGPDPVHVDFHPSHRVDLLPFSRSIGRDRDVG